jgi:predicted Fe-Mo cluster-binding NifX family protein
MRIAIPIYGEYISPRLDCAATLIVIEPMEKKVGAPLEHSLSEITDNERPAFLAKLSVKILLCGGIRRRDYFALEGLGIEVIPGLMGSWRTLLDEYMAGRLKPAAPGFRESVCCRAGGPKGRGLHGRHNAGRT